MASRRASTASSATNASASNGSAHVPRRRSSSRLGASTAARCVRIRASAISPRMSSWLTKQTQRLIRQRAGSLRYWGLRAPGPLHQPAPRGENAASIERCLKPTVVRKNCAGHIDRLNRAMSDRPRGSAVPCTAATLRIGCDNALWDRSSDRRICVANMRRNIFVRVMVGRCGVPRGSASMPCARSTGRDASGSNVFGDTPRRIERREQVAAAKPYGAVAAADRAEGWPSVSPCPQW
jgi:hypothetical protein